MVTYRERLRVPFSWWFIAIALTITLFVVVAVPVGLLAGALVGGITLCLLVGFYIGYAAPLEVSGQRFRAGRASIERAHLGRVEALTGEEARRAFGRDCDPKAFLLLRTYAKGAIRVENTDPRDPAPYWVVATRHPERLAAALSGNSVTRS